MDVSENSDNEDNVQDGGLSYSALRQLYRDERKKAELCELPEDFYGNLKDFLSGKLSHARKTKSFNDIKEYEHSLSTAREFISTREKKIAMFALVIGKDAKSKHHFTDEESKLFDSILASLVSFRSSTGIPSDEKETTKIKFISDVPEFVGEDGKNYGPYSSGQVVELQKQEAKYMVENNLAEEEI